MANFEELQHDIVQGIIRARERVYSVGKPTSLEQIHISGFPVSPWIKREDLGPIKAYKWRGAFNAIAALTNNSRQKGIVAASAGNHAQGVALACAKLECKATIFMPRSTPVVKQREVARHGGEWVTIVLHGDSYDEASEEAHRFAEEEGSTFIHPYNDPNVIAGQGTAADEIIMSGEGPFDRAYVAIGGGGLASATAIWLKHFWPDIEIIGVEGEDQNSMQRAIEYGSAVELPYVDVFCDGTAVKKVGDNTHTICSQLLDRIVTVSNDQVCDAVRLFWEANRIIPEPSGAMGLAGMILDHATNPITQTDKVLTILCGANMDFAQVGKIAERSGIGQLKRISFRIGIPDGYGTLIQLLESLPQGVSIVDMQYGRNHEGEQFPVITFAANETQRDEIHSYISNYSNNIQEVSHQKDISYRMIPFDKSLLHHPEFAEIEFPERAGALREFMKHISELTSLFYFNYSYSGERVGRALIGMDYTDKAKQQECHEKMNALTNGLVRSVSILDKQIEERIF